MEKLLVEVLWPLLHMSQIKQLYLVLSESQILDVVKGNRRKATGKYYEIAYLYKVHLLSPSKNEGEEELYFCL